MKQIVNGKRYDTETAERIGEASKGYSGDFHAWAEVLYRTKKGAFFLHGEGGALTSWGRTSGNGNERSWGEGIRPLTPDEALEWCEQHLDAEDFEGVFGGIEDA